MATGGNFSETLEGGHEPFYDFSCSLCEDDGKYCEAFKYCEECFVYLCEPCLREKHNKFPLNKGHCLLDQSQFASVNKFALVSFPTKRCTKHPGELINIFCGNHDVVCCSVCKALEHSFCLETQHLPDAAKGIHTSREFHDIVTGIRTLVSDVEKALNNRKADLSRVAKEKQSVRKTIADFSTKIKKYFEDLEEKSLADLDHREQMIVARIDKNKKYLETTKSKAEGILKQFESFKGDNECDIFVQVKTGLQFLNDTLNTIPVISEEEEIPSLHFEINRNIEEYLSSLKSFGTFSSTDVIATPPLLSADPHVKTSCLTELPAEQRSDYDEEYVIYKALKCKKFDVKKMSDTNLSFISSICQLPDDTFLLTDWKDKKLKRLDHSLSVLDSVKLSYSPHSVCAAGPGQAAVSMTRDMEIQLVSVGRKLKRTRSYTVGNECRGIAYIGNELFVCCGNDYDSSSYCVEVYSNSGQLQRTIPQKRLSSLPNYITISDDGQHLLVTSYKSDVITMLDLTGNVVNTFSHKDLRMPTGICTGGRGEVFICGYNSDTVVQLSPKLQKMDVILKGEDGIYRPTGVFYDMKLSSLLVSCSDKNELLSFTLTP